MYVNGSSSRSLPLNTTALNRQYCIQWRNRVQTSYAAQGVDLGSIDNTAAGIQLNSPSACYLKFTTPNFTFHGSIGYSNIASHVYANNSTRNISTILRIWHKSNRDVIADKR